MRNNAKFLTLKRVCTCILNGWWQLLWFIKLLWFLDTFGYIYKWCKNLSVSNMSETTSSGTFFKLIEKFIDDLKLQERTQSKKKKIDLRWANTFKELLEMGLLGMVYVHVQLFKVSQLSPQMVVLICTSIGEWSFVGLLLPTLVSNIWCPSDFRILLMRV